jgi:hypothetical protein
LATKSRLGYQRNEHWREMDRSVSQSIGIMISL